MWSILDVISFSCFGANEKDGKTRQHKKKAFVTVKKFVSQSDLVDAKKCSNAELYQKLKSSGVKL